MTPSSNSVWGDHKSTLDGCSGPSPCQRSSSPPPAAYAPAREKRETKSFTDWQLQYPCTFGDLSAGRAPACRNPVAGRPPLSKRLHRLIVLLPIPPPPPPDSVGDLLRALSEARTWDGPKDGPPAPVIESTTRLHGCPAFYVSTARPAPRAIHSLCFLACLPAPHHVVRAVYVAPLQPTAPTVPTIE